MAGDSFEQRTLQRAVLVEGVGLHSGSKVSLRLLPAPVNHGLVFARVDLPEDAAARFRNGVAVPVAGGREGRCVVYSGGILLGLADLRDGVAHPARLVAAPPPEPVSS